MIANGKKIVLVATALGFGTKDHLPILGLGYIASVLEKNGYNVKILDSTIHGYDNEAVIKHIINESPDAIGLSCISGNRFDAIKIINGIRAVNEKVFIFGGGRHFHHTWFNSLEKIKSLDAIVRGEGEITTLEMLNSYFSGGRFDNISGVAYRKDGVPVANGERPPIENLDELPWPAWHLYEMDKYRANLEGFEGVRSIGVISSRGCPSSCTFCANNSFWPRLRRRSPKDFVDEVEFLKNKYGFSGFDFWDDTITIVKNHILDICSEIINRKLNIIWYCRARVNTLDEEILTAMKEAGCRVIGFGIESGSEKVLSTIKKNISLEQVKKTFWLCAKMGFITKGFFIYGLPSETKDDLIKTRILMEELKSYGSKFRSETLMLAGLAPILYPGTEMTLQAQKDGSLPSDFDWSKEVYFERNKKFGLNPYLPIYENKELPLEEIIKINKKFNRGVATILAKLYYYYRVWGILHFLNIVYKKLKVAFKNILFTFVGQQRN